MGTGASESKVMWFGSSLLVNTNAIAVEVVTSKRSRNQCRPAPAFLSEPELLSLGINDFNFKLQLFNHVCHESCHPFRSLPGAVFFIAGAGSRSHLENVVAPAPDRAVRNTGCTMDIVPLILIIGCSIIVGDNGFCTTLNQSKLDHAKSKI